MSERQQLLEQSKHLTNSIVQLYSARDYTRAADLPPGQNFADLEQDIQTVLTLTRSMGAYLAQATLGHLRSAITSLDAFHKTLEEMRRFSGDQQAAQTLRNRFADVCSQHLATMMSTYVIASGQLSDPLANLRSRANETVTAIQNQMTASLTTIKTAESQAMAIIDGMRAASGEAGVKAHAERFEGLANRHDKASNMWLAFAAALALTTIDLALYVGAKDLTAAQAFTPQAVQQLATKALIIVTMYSLTMWAVRNYRANRHLAVLNRHKESALRTFETFVNATNKDPQVKNAVLQAAAECIFTANSTGYLSGDEDQSPARIVEVLKTFGGK
jgi:hypothetical protein